MSGNFVHCKRERQRIVYIHNIHVYYICKQYAAARACSARNFPTFLGRLCFNLGLVYTACYERTELIIYVARSGTLVACIFDLYVTTISEPNASWEKLNMF